MFSQASREQKQLTVDEVQKIWEREKREAFSPSCLPLHTNLSQEAVFYMRKFIQDAIKAKMSQF